MKLAWLKVASVTKGGKPYFWYALTKKYHIRVVWDRGEGLWRVDIEHRRTGKKISNFFGTDKQAKKAVESNEDDWKAYI